MRATRDRLDIFILSDMVQIKRGRKSIELMPLDEADALGRDLCLAVAAARATQPIKHRRHTPSSPEATPPSPGAQPGESVMELVAMKTLGAAVRRAEPAKGGGERHSAT